MRAVKIAANIPAGLDCVLWGGLLWAGIYGIEGVITRVGHSSSTQIFFYIGVPGGVTAALILSAVIFNFVGRCPLCLGILSVVVLVILPPYLAMYGGGV